MPASPTPTSILRGATKSPLPPSTLVKLFIAGPPEPPEPTANSSHIGLSGGVIAGIVVGTVVGVVIVLGLGLWIVILKRKTALSHPRSRWPEVSEVDNNN
jgi:hypothetical protein